MHKPLNILLLLLALVIAIVPVFSDCQSQGRSITLADGRSIPMKCHWSGIAEIGIAVPLGLTALLNLRKQRKEMSRTLATFGAASGALAILFPTVLIGVCANPDMTCRMIMMPTLVAAGILSILVSGVLFASARDAQLELSAAVA